MDHLIEITHGYSVGRDSECFLALKAHLDLAIVPVTVLVPVSLTVAVFVFVVMPINVIIVFFILSEYMFLSEYLSYKYPKIIE